MPGVHSDVGGGYRKDFLNKVARLTMLQRVVEHTKLKIDDARFEKWVDSTVNQFNSEAEIVINNERDSDFLPTRLLWKLLPSFERLAGGSHAQQFLHPLCGLLEGRRIHVRSANAQYSMKRHSRLPVAQLAWFDRLAAQARPAVDPAPAEANKKRAAEAALKAS